MSNSQHKATNLVIQMSGAPGSGKSTIARLLRPYIDGCIIDHDILRSSLLKNAFPFDEAAKHAYNLQWELARDFMEQGVASVIIDSTCNYPQILNQGMELAKQYDYTYWYIECKVSDIDLLDKRLRSRLPMESQRSGMDCPPVAAQSNITSFGEDEAQRTLFTRWMDSPCRPDDNHIITLDSTNNPQSLCQEILQHINSV